MKKNSLLIFAFLLFQMFQSCSFNSYKYYSGADGVLLAVTKEYGDRIRLKFRNNRNSPVFLAYHRIEKTSLSWVGYRLVCYQDDLETDFGPNNHSGVGLSQLNAGDEFEFEIAYPPKLKRNCYVSVGYYSDVKALAIVEKYQNSILSVTPEEDEFLEQSKQKIIVTLNLNNTEDL